MERRTRPGVSKIALAVAVAAIVAVAGVAFYLTSNANGRTTQGSTSSTAASSFTFEIAISPAMPLVAPGQTQNYSSVLVSNPAGAGPAASLVLKAFAPAGISIVLNATSVTLANNPQSISFKLSASPNISPGKYQAAIGASSPAAESQNRTFTVEVVPALVIIQALAFHPQNITVPKGTLVSWINLDSNIGCCDPGNHNVVFLSGGNSSSPILKRLDTWSSTFGAAGTVQYYCSIHPYMKAQVTVNG